jgi:undecaprenyl-diphosphatase
VNATRQALTPAPGSGPRELFVSAALLAALAALLFVALTTAGLLLTRVLTPSALSRFDQRVIEWFAAQRTPTLNTWSEIGSEFAMTIIVFVMTVIIALALRLWLRRWRESLVLIVCVLGEWILFRLVNAAVGRERPEPMLDMGALTASFPSGHAGIAVAFYGGLGLIVLRTVADRRLAVGIASVCFAVAVMVAVTRVYRGMHYPTDVLGSALLGGVWVVAVVSLLLPRRKAVGGPRQATE